MITHGPVVRASNLNIYNPIDKPQGNCVRHLGANNRNEEQNGPTEARDETDPCP